MGIGPFAAVGLVPVAYIRVSGTLGTAPDSNSGLTVTKLGTGVYQIDIPPDLAVPQKECYPQVQVWNSVAFAQVQQASSADQLTRILVMTHDVDGAYVDTTFTLTIHRTVSPPVDGAPA